MKIITKLQRKLFSVLMQWIQHIFIKIVCNLVLPKLGGKRPPWLTDNVKISKYIKKNNRNNKDENQWFNIWDVSNISRMWETKVSNLELKRDWLIFHVGLKVMWKVQENCLPYLENSFSKTIECHYMVWLNNSSFLTKKKARFTEV